MPENRAKDKREKEKAPDPSARRWTKTYCQPFFGLADVVIIVLDFGWKVKAQLKSAEKNKQKLVEGRNQRFS